LAFELGDALAVLCQAALGAAQVALELLDGVGVGYGGESVPGAGAGEDHGDPPGHELAGRDAALARRLVLVRLLLRLDHGSTAVVTGSSASSSWPSNVKRPSASCRTVGEAWSIPRALRRWKRSWMGCPPRARPLTATTMRPLSPRCAVMRSRVMLGYSSSANVTRARSIASAAAAVCSGRVER